MGKEKYVILASSLAKLDYRNTSVEKNLLSKLVEALKRIFKIS
jgi:hypothetical protein